MFKFLKLLLGFFKHICFLIINFYLSFIISYALAFALNILMKHLPEFVSFFIIEYIAGTVVTRLNEYWIFKPKLLARDMPFVWSGQC